MDLKENILSQMVTIISSSLSSEQLRFVSNTMALCMKDYDLVTTKELPSIEVYDNEKILKHYFATKKMEGLAESTLNLYRWHILIFFKFINLPIKDYTTNHIRYYLADLGTRRSNSYADDARRILNTFFNFCVEEEYIFKNPVSRIKHIRQPKTIEKPYTDTEVEMLRDACIDIRDTAIIDFLLSTGCRRGEVIKIKLTDVDFIGRSVLIHGKGNKDRIVFFSARCEKHLKDYVTNRVGNSEYLFCSSRFPYNSLTTEGLATIVQKIGENAGVPHVHLHRFRKWFATYMANQGVPLQYIKEMMGHSSLDTTNNYYIYTNQEKIKQAYMDHAA